MAIKFVRLYGFSHENSFETDHFIGIGEWQEKGCVDGKKKKFLWCENFMNFWYGGILQDFIGVQWTLT